MAVSSRFRTYVAGLILVLNVVSTVAAKYGGGSGTVSDPYRIATATDLMLLSGRPEDYAAHFLLVADIDLDPSLPRQKVFDKAVIAPKTGTSGWLPPSGVAFAGVFDGGGHTISHLTIRGGDNLGLFGESSSRAEVKNLAVVDVNIVGSGTCIGGLVGHNDGRIRACCVQGEVRGGYWVGGLVGDTYGTITACYAQATVSGTKYVGGFTGGTGGTIVRCYATGQVVRADDCDFLGGFAGQGNANATFKGCLWDVEASGIGISGCGIGLDTARLMQPGAYALNGWAGDPNWVLAAGQDYARLAWEGGPGQAIAEPNVNDWLAGSGMAQDPYQIATADQLALVGTAGVLWDKALVLTDDLDVNGVQIQRIGASAGSEFRGSFDGRGHTIRNLVMDSGVQSAWLTGLFGSIHSDGRVSNVNLEHTIIKGGGQRSGYLGALAGLNHGSISNCTAMSALVEGRSAQDGTSTYLGGLIGYNDGSVDHCRAGGNVRGDVAVGGLVGLNYGDIVGCCADATVAGRMASMGGLVGTNAGRSTLVHDDGSLSVVVRRGTIKDSCATGQVAGDVNAGDVGGLAGGNDGGDIAGCYATGVVSGLWRVGGLVGYNTSGSTIGSSYATGNVTGRSIVGGFVAINAGTVTTCYAAGTVAGGEIVGGFVGYNSFGDVAGSFWDIQTSGVSESAGGTGKTTTELQTAKTFVDAGWDFAAETVNGEDDTWWIDEGKDYPHLSWERN